MTWVTSVTWVPRKTRVTWVPRKPKVSWETMMTWVTIGINRDV